MGGVSNNQERIRRHLSTTKEDFVVRIRRNVLERRSHVGADWNVIFTMSLWSIWKWRNAKVFDGEVANIDKASFIMARVREAMHVVSKPELCNGASNKTAHDISWTQPEEGWIKINTDGAIKDGMAIGGGVPRDSSGE